MSSASTTPTESEPAGQLLTELERRQDEVLLQLDDLDAKLTEVLKGLGVAEESLPDDEALGEDD